MGYGTKELMQLLRAFVWETPLTRDEVNALDRVLPEVLHLCKLHQIAGIWAYKMREYYADFPSLTEEEQEVFTIADELYSRAVAKGMGKAISYQALSKKLTEKGISHLPFKGIVVREFYAVPELRSYGDIDFVIRDKDRGSLHALMKELGYAVITDFEPVYTYRKEKELYEVHTSIMSVNMTERADYVGYFAHLWDYAVEAEPNIWAFTPEFHFIYLLTHIAKHIYSSGAGIRMYLDLAFYIKKLGDKLDWQWIQKEIEKLQLTEFFGLAMYAITRWFGVVLSIDGLEQEEELFSQFEAFTVEGGVFGFEGRSRGEAQVRKQGERGKALQSVLFPSAKTIQARYTYLQKYPWLLPVAWIDRLYRNYRRIGRMAEKTKEIMTVDEKELQEVTAFYRRIGL